MNVVLSIEAVRPPLAGIGRYVWELATRLPQHAEIESLRFLSDGLWRKLPEFSNEVKFDVSVRQNIPLTSQLRHRLGKIPLISRTYGKIMPMIASRQLDKINGGVFHGPNFFVPKTELASVVTIHDLSAYHHTLWHPLTRVERMRKLIPQAIERAHLVLTDSEATKQELITEFALADHQVHAIPLGVDDIYHPRQEDELNKTLAHFGLATDAYSFFVSTIEPRKNLLNLIQAYRQLSPAIRQRWPLVLAGAEGWNSQLIHEEITRATSEGWLKYLGFVGQEYLPALYAGCRLFTYPSSYEGFGLPIVEAMASGVPVLTSDCSSMPEVAAGCALLVMPDDVESIRLGLERSLVDEEWRHQAKKKGLCRAAELTWDVCVNQTVSAYQIAQSMVHSESAR